MYPLLQGFGNLQDANIVVGKWRWPILMSHYPFLSELSLKDWKSAFRSSASGHYIINPRNITKFHGNHLFDCFFDASKMGSIQLINDSCRLLNGELLQGSLY